MNPKRNIEPGELFFRFYKKRISSFLVTVYKAGITGKDRDIHKLHVDLKKINAMYSFFGMLEFTGLNIRKSAKHFRDIFRQAGRIREIQVNLGSVEKYSLEMPGLISFRKFLKKEQKKNTKAFILAVSCFDEKKLKAATIKVKRFCRGMDRGEILVRSGEFLSKKAGMIRSLAEHPENDENIHRIRQELKKMGAITSLLLQVIPGRETRQLMANINRAEVMIGEWHDRVVLMGAMEHFMRSAPEQEAGSLVEMVRLKERISAENSGTLAGIIPMVADLADAVLQQKPREQENKNKRE